MPILRPNLKWARLRGFAFFVFAFLLSGASTAQNSPSQQLQLEVQRLNGDLSYLTRVLQNMQGELVVMQKQTGLGSSTVASASGLVVYESRLSSLESQLRNLTGELERLDFKLRQDAKDRQRFEDVLVARMRELEEQVATVGVPNPERLLNPVKITKDRNQAGDVGVELSGFPATAETDVQDLPTVFDPYGTAETAQTNPAADQPTINANDLYQSALSHFQAQQFSIAQEQFELFLQMHSENELASNASYWLGETFYSQDDYTRAALQFSDGFTKYRTGNKAADHLLKLGLSLHRLNRSSEACASYGLLSRRFGTDRPALVQRARVEAANINCAQ